MAVWFVQRIIEKTKKQKKKTCNDTSKYGAFAYITYIFQSNQDINQYDKGRNRNSFSQKQFIFDRAFWSVDNLEDNFTDQIHVSF